MYEEQFFYFFYKMYYELHTLLLMTYSCRLHALYLDSALVQRKVCALWKYNELFLTNHGVHFSEH